MTLTMDDGTARLLVYIVFFKDRTCSVIEGIPRNKTAERIELMPLITGELIDCLKEKLEAQ